MKQVKAVTTQLENEPMQDYIKFLVFLEMGATRSLEQTYRKYYETGNNQSPAWNALAQKYHWTERAAAYDKAVDQIKKQPVEK